MKALSTSDSIFGKSSFEARLNLVLRGRKPHPWGVSLGLKPATITRLKNGQFPDPEKLMPACRAENLSLSWLLYGIGTPYLIQVAVDPGDAMDRIHALWSDEPWSMLIAHTNSSWIPVLHQPAALLLPDGSTLNYRIVQVIAGAIKGCEARLADRLAREPISSVTSLELKEPDWRRLASGYMGSIELFEQTSTDHGLPTVLAPRALGLGEERSHYEVLTAAEREASLIMRNLDLGDRDAALRMLRGLALRDS
jgi:hypothetical protein